MIKRIIVLAALAAVASVATAQMDDQPSDIELRFGVLFPLDDEVRDSQDLLFGGGIEYFFDEALFDQGETSISLDWFVDNLTGAEVNVVPVLVNHRWFPNGDEFGENDTFFSAGVGIVFVDVGQNEETFGGQLTVGKEFGANTNAQIKLYIAGEGTSLGVFVGYKFR